MEKVDEKPNYLVAGEGSPISLNKVLEDKANGVYKKEFCVFIDNTYSGFALDAPGTVYLTVDARTEQAVYFVERIFDGRIPCYLYRYLHYMYHHEEYEMKYPKDEDVVKAFESGALTVESEEYKKLQNMIKYSGSNKSVQQMIGLITLLGGTLLDCKKRGKYIRIYIEEPETHLHPQQERRVISLLHKLREEYGFPPEETKTEAK